MTPDDIAQAAQGQIADILTEWGHATGAIALARQFRPIIDEAIAQAVEMERNAADNALREMGVLDALETALNEATPEEREAVARKLEADTP